MAVWSITSKQSGKTFNNGAGGSIIVFGMDLFSAKWFDLVVGATINLSSSGETTFDISLLQHPSHEVVSATHRFRVDGPLTAGIAFITTQWYRPNGTFKSQLTTAISLPTISSSQFLLFAISTIFGWLPQIQDIDVGGTWRNRVFVRFPGSGGPIVIDTDIFWTVTNFVSPSTFQEGIFTIGSVWVNPTLNKIEFVDVLQIKHSIPGTSILPAAGSEPGQIWIDDLLPRFGYISNELKHFTRTATLESVNVPPGNRARSGEEPGFWWCGTSVTPNDRIGHLEFIAADGKKYNISDGEN